MKSIAIAVMFACTLALQASAGYTISWRTGTQDKYVRRWPKHHANTSVSRHRHDAFCQCKFHAFMTEPARLVKREGGRMEHVQKVDSRHMKVMKTTSCRMCNGTGRSMSKTCTSYRWEWRPSSCPACPA